MSVTSDLTYSDTEDALRESVRALLGAHCPSARVTAMYDGDDSVSIELWQTVSASMELAGIGISEACGGGGAASREVAVVMEELGRAVAPLPFLTSSVIAATVLASCGADDHLRSLVDGGQVAALVVPFTAMDLADIDPPHAYASGALDGAVRGVAGLPGATLLLVPAISAGEITLQAVTPDPATTSIIRRSSLDMTRPIADIELTGAPTVELARGDTARAAIEAGLLRGAALLASEQVGIAEWCLESTVAYATTRTQFGRPIGSFQAVKHRLARLWIAVNGARAAARQAAVLIDGNDDAARSATWLAQAYCSDVAVLAAEECVQLHGGIGMTWEHPAHLYLKRAKADQLALGTPAHHRAAIGRALEAG